MDTIIKALAFEKVLAHLNQAQEKETRLREQRRIRIALKHLARLMAEAEKEVRDARASTS